MIRGALVGLMLVAAALARAAAADLDRLAYLDGADPFYPSGSFAKLTTPQWVGEEGVEAVVVLSIDDLRDKDFEKYERYLRPILDRLARIDGRAPVSIMANRIDPRRPELQAWLRQGLSIEAHTIDHRHPLLQGGSFAASKASYDAEVDLLAKIPGSSAVAHRTPWCDVLSVASPRLFAEIMNARTPAGRFLTIDSSIANLFTAGPDLRKYLPRSGRYATYVENYPYPYVVGRLVWEMPFALPDDALGRDLNGPGSERTIADLKAVLDATVARQGVFTLVFHPHGWLAPEQHVALIDHAVARHGRRVKFLTFREVQERIDRNLLSGHPLRAHADGGDNGVRLLDLNDDGHMDVLIGNERTRLTRLWRPAQRRWEETEMPVPLVESRRGRRESTGVRFLARPGGQASMIVRSEDRAGAWDFEGGRWVAVPALLAGLEVGGKPVYTARGGRDRGVRFRDIDRDGNPDAIVGNETDNAVLRWATERRAWTATELALPRGTSIVNARGEDNGLRFVDISGDGVADVVFSNEERYAVYLWITPGVHRDFNTRGWTRAVSEGRRGDPGAVPAFVRRGRARESGAWFHSGALWVHNEDTTALPEHVDRRAFAELIVGYQPPPLSPAESLRTMDVAPGFEMQLVAAEPLVGDPVGFEWGPDGRLWVADMRDYPKGVDGKGTPGGQIRVLADKDGDGVFDDATVFLDGIGLPTGVLPWRNGVLISAAPNIVYAEDTNGDGKADRRTVLFTGFGLENEQHVTNGFEVGLDNWVYVANGWNGGKVRKAAPGLMTAGGPAIGTTIDIRSRDFRFRPDSGEFELAAGSSEFGRWRDDFGNAFGSGHPKWGWHYFLPLHYAARNPHLPVRMVKRHFATSDESERVYRKSRLMARPQSARPLSHVTAPCCLAPYRDELFGPTFATSVFIAEVDKNVIHREVLQQSGVSFESRRAPGERRREFVASTDNWFRPTTMKTGPDGALYVADMYRQVIEHSDYYPADVRALIDFRAGHDRGRIYRILPRGAKLRAAPRMDRLGTAELVAALRSPNGWQRDTAQRLLVTGGDRTAVPALARLVREDKSPKTRVQALSTLGGLGAVDAALVTVALEDRHPAVREHAIRVAEPLLRKEVDPALASRLLARVTDGEVRVRYQLAFTLGEWQDARAAEALAAIADRDAGNEDVELAVLSSALPHLRGLVRVALANGRESPLLARLVGLATAVRDEEALTEVLTQMQGSAPRGEAAWKWTALAAIVDALDQRGSSLADLHGRAGGPLRAALASIDGIFADARRVAVDAGAAEAERVLALSLLGRGRDRADEDRRVLASLLGPQAPVVVQEAAVARLGRSQAPDTADLLLAGWAGHGPKLRASILGALTSRPAWAKVLLAAVSAGVVARGDLDPTLRQRLLGHADAQVRGRAAEVLAAASSDRQTVIARYHAAVSLAGDPARGAEQYRRNCALCHRLRGEGVVVGPDLTGMSSKSTEDLITAILDPNQFVIAAYASYQVTTKDGRELTGVLAAETSSSITLRLAGGAEEVVLRSEVQEIRNAGSSLMPEGFEAGLSPADLADLIAFIRAAPAGRARERRR